MIILYKTVKQHLQIQSNSQTPITTLANIVKYLYNNPMNLTQAVKSLANTVKQSSPLKQHCCQVGKTL